MSTDLIHLALLLVNIMDEKKLSEETRKKIFEEWAKIYEDYKKSQENIKWDRLINESI